jgi:hypothetical protein
MDLQVGGTSQFKVSKVGNVTATGTFSGNNYITTGGVAATFNEYLANKTNTGTSGSHIGYSMTSSIAPTSGTMTYTGFSFTSTINQTGGANGITRGIYINPTLTSAADFRALEITTGKSIFGGTIRLKNYTVATLPAGTQGDVAYATDLLAPTFGATATGGGAVVLPVFFDGTNWKVI